MTQHERTNREPTNRRRGTTSGGFAGEARTCFRLERLSGPSCDVMPLMLQYLQSQCGITSVLQLSFLYNPAWRGVATALQSFGKGKKESQERTQSSQQEKAHATPAAEDVAILAGRHPLPGVHHREQNHCFRARPVALVTRHIYQ